MTIKGDAPENTTIAYRRHRRGLTKAEAKRLAIMAQDGIAHALRPAHAAIDGDTVFAAARERRPTALRARPDRDRHAAADCLARAIARAIYEATSLPFAGALASWKSQYG